MNRYPPSDVRGTGDPLEKHDASVDPIAVEVDRRAWTVAWGGALAIALANAALRRGYGRVTE